LGDSRSRSSASPLQQFARVAMDFADEAKRHRLQAGEFRAKADLMRDEIARNSYHKVADAYDAMAASEERMAADPVLRLRAAE